MSLEQLPVDVLGRIIHFVVHYETEVSEYEQKFLVMNLPPGAFSLNSANYPRDSYKDLLKLSTTCILLRKLIAPLVFRSVSLIRENEIDSILQSSAYFRYFLDKKKYHRQFMKEVLNRGFEECLRSDMARKSFRIQTDLSNYQKHLSINNFVTIVECDNSMIGVIEDGLIFPNLKTLKILDTAIIRTNHTTKQVEAWKNLKLDYLSINCASFPNYYPLHFCIPNLKRLDILCQISQMDPLNAFSSLLEDLSPNIVFRLQELNIFINDNCFIKYEQFLQFLESIVQKSPHLQKLAIRISFRRGDETMISTRNWKLYDECPNGTKFLNIINLAPKLEICVLDLSSLALMTLSETKDLLVPAKSRSLTLLLVESPLSTPPIPLNLRELICEVIWRLGADKITFYYGEAMEQASIQALKVVSELVLQLSLMSSSSIRMDTNKQGIIKRVNLEMCWSISDDTIRRSYYSKLLELRINGTMDAHEKRKLYTATVWGKLASNSPRYRSCEAYEVKNVHTEFLISPVEDTALTIPNSFDFAAFKLNPVSVNRDEIEQDSYFWGVECSLSDLEEYAFKPRKSRLLIND